jgi:predicted enzyme related to lactoylglutathione lyase
MESVDVRGRFVWHQLATRDVPGARKFYSKLIGWNPQPWPLDPTYIVCHSEAGPVAGMMQLPPEAPANLPAHWLTYIGTRDVDAIAEAAARAGGSIIKAPSEMKGAGRYALLTDPQGAMFAIIDPENARPEHIGIPRLGTFSWHELATTDNEAAFSFYSQLFGWDAITRMDMGSNGVYLVFGTHGVQRGGMYIKPPGWPAPPNWLPYAHVPDADRGFELATSIGAKELMAPMTVPGGSRIASFTDPGGAAVAIHSMPVVEPKIAKKPGARVKPKSQTKAKSRTKSRIKPRMKAKARVKYRKVAPKRSALKGRKSSPPKTKSKKTKMKTKMKRKKK